MKRMFAVLFVLVATGAFGGYSAPSRSGGGYSAPSRSYSSPSRSYSAPSRSAPSYSAPAKSSPPKYTAPAKQTYNYTAPAKSAPAAQPAAPPSGNVTYMQASPPMVINQRSGLGVMDYLLFWHLFRPQPQQYDPPGMVCTGGGGCSSRRCQPITQALPQPQGSY